MVKKVSKTSKLYKNVQPLTDVILHGRMISIDPASGAKSSTAYAVYEQGNLLGSNVCKIPQKQSLPLRLQELKNQLEVLNDTQRPDIIALEDPSIIINTPQGQIPNKTLACAVAVCMVCFPESEYLLVHPASWKSKARKDYVKSDLADAIEIGWVVLDTAAYISQRETLELQK